MLRRRRAALLGALALGLVVELAPGAHAATRASDPGWFPAASLGGPIVLPTGRTVSPAGDLVPLETYPTGAAVAPDGKTMLVIAGNPVLATTETGVPTMQLRVLDTASGLLLQTIAVGDAFQAVAYSQDGSEVYVAGGGDQAVHSYAVGPGGLLGSGVDLPLPGCDAVTGLALTRDGRRLWAACPDSGRVAELSLPGGSLAAVVPLPAPDQLALSPDGGTLYATDWRGASVAVVNTASGAASEVAVGSHPEGIAVLPDGRAVVADANDATLATIALGTLAVAFTRLSMVASHRDGDAPDDVAVGAAGRLFVSLGGDDAVAVLSPAARVPPGQPGAWNVDGLIPAAWDPTAVTASPDGQAVFVLDGYGLGHSAPATAPYISPDPLSLGIDGAYATVGTLQRIADPDPAELLGYTRAVEDSLAVWRPSSQTATALLGPDGPIHHVIYVTRENKTYDSELGDVAPGPGAPLAVFGQTVTPNLHALVRGYVDSSSFYYPAFQSTTGHMWEDAGGPSDGFLREVSDPALDDSWRESTNYPDTGLLVEQAWRAGLSVRTYNEELAQQSGLLPAAYQADPSVFPNYDLAYPDTGRERGWESEFDQFEAHRCTGSLAAAYGADCRLPALEYVYLGEDHTTVEDKPGYPSIEAQVADNDYATGLLVQAVSHSPDWPSTLVIVEEDDPQGTGDHVSAYRGLVALAGPYVRRGHLSGVHYQWSSAVAAIDRILGLVPLTDSVAQARPLDDLFTDAPDLAPYTADPSGARLYPFTPLP